MPAGMAAWSGLSGATLTTQSSAESSSPSANATLTTATAAQTGGGSYGFATSSNGRAYIQTSSNSSVGANQFALAIVTTGLTNIAISYDVEIISAQPRTVGIVMQYRVGTSGSWTTVSGSGNPYSQAGGTTGIKASPSLTLPAGANNQAVVQIRWATWRGTESGNSSGIAIDNISVTGNNSSPTISVGTITGFGNQVINTTSGEQHYSVSGINLTENVIVTPPNGFQISETAESGYTSDPITLTQSGGGVGPTTIYVKFAPTALSAYSGNITHTSLGADLKNVAVSGKGISTEPGSQSSNPITSVVQETQFTLSWDPGTGSSRLVLVKAGSAVDYTPLDGTSYSANSVFATGTQYGTGNYVVYSGTGTSVTITGLSGSTTYHYSILSPLRKIRSVE